MSKYEQGDMIRVNSKTNPRYLIILEYTGKILNSLDTYNVFDLEAKEIFNRTFADSFYGTYTKVA